MPLGAKRIGEAALTGSAVVAASSGPDILDLLPYPLAEITHEFGFLKVNRAWESAFGGIYSASDVFGVDLCEVLQQGICGDTECRIVAGVGKMGPYLAHATPSPTGFVVVLRDIAEEVHRDAGNRSQIEWYRRALQAAGEGSWEFDVESRSCWLSPTLLEKLGFGLTDHVCLEQLLQRIHPDDRAHYVARRQEALDGLAPLHTEIRLMTPMGDRWSMVSGAVLRDEEGKALRVAGMVVDIHERKLIEEQLRELNRALESKVADRTRELAQTNEELQSFCYSVSHDLRGPLRSINGFGKALEEEYGYMFDDQGRDYLRRIRKAAIRLSGLIDGLLNLARITQAGMRREPLNIGEIARELLDDLSRTDPERQTQIAIDDELRTYGDANLVRLALANLIENAWKFSSRCEVTRIEVGQEGDAFFVRDGGAGFNMEYAAKLFAPFERLHTENEFPGSGLGLAVVQRVIQRHHGAVWAEGAPGEGAVVYFTLPSRKRDRKGQIAP